MELIRDGDRWVVRSTFEERAVPKAAGCRWDRERKCWYTEDRLVAGRLAEYAHPSCREELERAKAEREEALAASRATDSDVEIPCPEGLEFFPYQRAGVAFASARPATLIGDDMGLGKGQPVDAPVLTPSGWKPIGAVSVGDEVIGRDGRPTKVTGVFPRGRLPVFRVAFSDGAKLIVDGDHLWAVRTPTDQMLGRDWRILDTRTLLQQGTRDRAGNRRWRIPLVRPVELDCGRDRPVDPYVLGVLLGDGALAGDRTANVFTPGDEMVAHAVGERIPSGHRLSAYESPTRVTAYRIVSDPKFAPNAVLDGMRQLGLVQLEADERFVPRSYLFAPTDVRLEVLRGLMDTDGEYRASDGHVGFNSASRQLVEDVRFLVESLGGCCKPVRSRVGKLNGVPKRHSYRITVAMPDDRWPFRERAPAQIRSKYKPNRIIDSIEPAGDAEVVCISVDAPDHLYVTDRFIVTHNTCQAIGVVNLDPTVRRVLIVCPASLKANWAIELRRWLTRDLTIGIAASRYMPKTDVVIANYDILTKLPLESIEWDLLVADECHMAKNPKAMRKYQRQLPANLVALAVDGPAANDEDEKEAANG